MRGTVNVPSNRWRGGPASPTDSFVRLLRLSLLTIGILAASGLMVLVASPRLEADEVRGALTASELTTPVVGAVEIVDYSWFLPAPTDDATGRRRGLVDELLTDIRFRSYPPPPTLTGRIDQTTPTRTSDRPAPIRASR